MEIVLTLGFIVIIGTILKARAAILNALEYQTQVIQNTFKLAISQLNTETFKVNENDIEDIKKFFFFHTHQPIADLDSQINLEFRSMHKRLEKLERETNLARLYSELTDSRLYHVIKDYDNDVGDPPKTE